MPPIRRLLRIFLILALCADGTTAAWAATRMAVNQVAHASLAAGASAKSGRETNHGHRKASAAASVPGKRDQGGHEDCDCGDLASCTCAGMLVFHPGQAAPLFAAQHALASMHLAQPLLPPVPTGISRRFRPPIC